MTGFSTQSKLINDLLKTGLPKKIYHSVIIRQDSEQQRKPSAPVGDRFEYVGPDDQQGFYGYIRQIGPIETQNAERLSSCSQWDYRIQSLHRAVFYNAEEKRNHDDLAATLLKAFMSSGSGVKFQRMEMIAENILKQEAPSGRFKFPVSTFYVAIEFLLLLKIQTDTCSSEIKCEGIKNPFCI